MEPAPFAAPAVTNQIWEQIDAAGGFLPFIENLIRECEIRSHLASVADREADVWITRASILEVVRKYDIEAPRVRELVGPMDEKTRMANLLHRTGA